MGSRYDPNVKWGKDRPKNNTEYPSQQKKASASEKFSFVGFNITLNELTAPGTCQRRLQSPV